MDVTREMMQRVKDLFMERRDVLDEYGTKVYHDELTPVDDYLLTYRFNALTDEINAIIGDTELLDFIETNVHLLKH